MLIIIRGDVGSGKTLLATYINIKSVIPVKLSNYPIKINAYQPLKPEELMELPYDKVLVTLDEIYTYLESYFSSSKVSLYLDYVLFQSRKRGIDIIGTLQLFRRLNINFREMWNVLIDANKGQKGFNYTYNYKKNEEIHQFFRTMPFSLAEKIYPYYDTKKVIMPSNINELKYGFIKDDPIKLKALVEQAVNDLRPKLNKITKESVKACLQENGYTPKITNNVFSHLKDEVKESEKFIKES